LLGFVIAAVKYDEGKEGTIPPPVVVSMGEDAPADPIPGIVRTDEEDDDEDSGYTAEAKEDDKEGCGACATLSWLVVKMRGGGGRIGNGIGNIWCC
jgi:hypothetical protein